MADAVASQTIQDGERTAVMRFTNVSGIRDSMYRSSHSAHLLDDCRHERQVRI